MRQDVRRIKMVACENVGQYQHFIPNVRLAHKCLKYVASNLHTGKHGHTKIPVWRIEILEIHKNNPVYIKIWASNQSDQKILSDDIKRPKKST